MKKANRLNVSLIAGILAIGAVGVSFADDHADEESRKAYREMKREHKKEMREMRRAHHAGKMLEKVDANQDGKVDLDEYLAHAQERFNRLDLDANGYVTKEEAQEAMKKMRKEHKERYKEKRKKHLEESE